MAELATIIVDYDGEPLTFAPADAAGDTFTHSTDAVVLVQNNGAAEIAVSITSQRVDRQGFATADSTSTVAVGATAAIGGLSKTAFSDAEGNVHVSYSDVTDVVVAVIRPAIRG